MIRILIADDEMDVLYSLKAFFEAKGYKVFIAPRGMDALNYLKTEKPDIMILDLKMRDMNGMDVLKQAKTILPSVKTIVATGSDDEDLKDEAMKLGAVDYITKPVRLADLEKRIAELNV